MQLRNEIPVFNFKICSLVACKNHNVFFFLFIQFVWLLSIMSFHTQSYRNFFHLYNANNTFYDILRWLIENRCKQKHNDIFVNIWTYYIDWSIGRTGVICSFKSKKKLTKWYSYIHWLLLITYVTCFHRCFHRCTIASTASHNCSPLPPLLLTTASTAVVFVITSSTPKHSFRCHCCCYCCRHCRHGFSIDARLVFFFFLNIWIWILIYYLVYK